MVVSQTNGSTKHGKLDGASTATPTICLVTGGTGLVGRALQHVIDTESLGSRYGKQDADEQWIFLSSKDGDLRCVGASILDRDHPL